MVKKYGVRNKVPRTIFGTKKIVKVDKFSNTKYTESDIMGSYVSIVSVLCYIR